MAHKWGTEGLSLPRAKPSRLVPGTLWLAKVISEIVVFPAKLQDPPRRREGLGGRGCRSSHSTPRGGGNAGEFTLFLEKVPRSAWAL